MFDRGTPSLASRPSVADIAVGHGREMWAAIAVGSTIQGQ
jgi:hypothetical protein